MGHRSLILASASPARRATLSAANIRHSVMVSEVDEDALLESARKEAGRAELSAAEQVELLASAKAHEVAQRILEAGFLYSSADLQGVTAVAGCDSMFEFDGQIVGKPHSPDVARERLHRMSGRAGRLYTGHCVIDLAKAAGKAAASEGGEASERGADALKDALQVARGVSVATVHIAPMSDEEIDAYIASGEPLEVAGSFTIDGLGGPFVERIEGDHHGVVGISLPLLRKLLAHLGYSVTDFWE